MSGQPTVESPCIDVCEMHAATGLCSGCFRTLAEIEGWAAFPAARRTAILRAVAARRQALVPETLPRKEKTKQ